MAKWTLRFFGLLDLIAFVYAYDFAILQLESLLGNEPQTVKDLMTKLLFILLWISLLLSAILLFIPKKSGIFLGYIQLIPRFIFLMLSFGFISYLTYFIPNLNFDKYLLPLVIFLELARTYQSYRFQNSNLKV